MATRDLGFLISKAETSPSTCLCPGRFREPIGIQVQGMCVDVTALQQSQELSCSPILNNNQKCAKKSLRWIHLFLPHLSFRISLGHNAHTCTLPLVRCSSARGTGCRLNGHPYRHQMSSKTVFGTSPSASVTSDMQSDASVLASSSSVSASSSSSWSSSSCRNRGSNHTHPKHGSYFRIVDALNHTACQGAMSSSTNSNSASAGAAVVGRAVGSGVRIP